jgi:hypothetical protein
MSFAVNQVIGNYVPRTLTLRWVSLIGSEWLLVGSITRAAGTHQVPVGGRLCVRSASDAASHPNIVEFHDALK